MNVRMYGCQYANSSDMLNQLKTKKMSKTKYVAFSTQKGGAGKTTLTVIVASYLHYVKGYNVAVIDCRY